VVGRFPKITGIDFAGEVVRSDDGRYAEGDRVLLNGWGVGEVHYGGFSERARVNADWLIPLPKGLSEADAMVFGTAGYTAMLAVMALERHDVGPSSGPVAVSGAAGGVGSMAIMFLSRLGYEVHAITGRPEEEAYLKGLGAAEIVPRDKVSGEPRPLARETWAGVVDTVGSNPLANLLASTRRAGTVIACGNAAGMDLPGSVAPFILRGVTLVGIDSVMAPYEVRSRAWSRIARDFDRDTFADVTRTIPLTDVEAVATEIMDGKVRGRVVVDVAPV